MTEPTAINDEKDDLYRKYIPVLTVVCCLLSILLFAGINLQRPLDNWEVYAKWGAPSPMDIFSGSYWGFLVVLIGVLLYMAGYRTLQPRITMGALPFILWGGALYLWGWRVAKMLTFPIFFFWLAIPLPSFQQATTNLQLLATSLAHHGSGLLGVETYTQGTTILPVKGDWKPLSIAHGCSGIRSLMALLMISAAWAYMARMAMWKRILLFLSAFPLAIVGNALRVISIFVIAEYGNAEWASTTWHDWSGLLLFYPFSLMLLLVIHSILEGGLPWKSKQRRQLLRTTVSAPAPECEVRQS